MKKRKINKKILALGLGASILALPMLVLTSCKGSAEGLNPDSIINLLFPNVWVFIGQLISMAILFVVILFFIWKPTNAMLERRQALIASEVEEATEMKEQAQKQLDAMNFMQEEAKEKANKIILDAENRASELFEKTQLDAQKEHQKIVSSGKEQVELELRKIQKEAEHEIVNKAIKAAEVLMKKQINKSENEKLVKEFIESLE